MGNLENHFGDDASLDFEDTKNILEYLVKNSAENSTMQASLNFLNSIKDKDGNAHPGGLNFKVGPQSAGCYTFGSTADAIRGSYDGCLDIAESDYNQKQTVVGGQSHNRYAFFSVPVGVNYIELDIKELTVFFDKR